MKEVMPLRIPSVPGTQQPGRAAAGDRVRKQGFRFNFIFFLQARKQCCEWTMGEMTLRGTQSLPREASNS